MKGIYNLAINKIRKIKTLKNKINTRKKNTKNPNNNITLYKYRRIVRLIYLQILEREPDPEGLEHYTKSLYNKDSIPRIVFRIASSDEAYNKHIKENSLARAIKTLFLYFEYDLEWRAVFETLAKYGTLTQHNEESVFSEKASDNKIIGRIIINLHGTLSGWLIDLKNPEKPIKIIAKTNNKSITLSNDDLHKGNLFVGKTTLLIKKPTRGIYIENYMHQVFLRASNELLSQAEEFDKILEKDSNALNLLSTKSSLISHNIHKHEELSDFIIHLMYQREIKNIKTYSLYKKTEYLQWYLMDYRESLERDSCFNYSDKVKEYLQENALSEGISPFHVNRLLFLFWKRHSNKKDCFFDINSYRHLVYKLASSTNSGSLSFYELMGVYLTKTLTENSPFSSQLPYGINYYWEYALRDEIGHDEFTQISHDKYICIIFRKTFHALYTGSHVSFLPNDWLLILREPVSDNLSIAEKFFFLLFQGYGEEKKWLDDKFFSEHPQLKILSFRHIKNIDSESVVQELKSIVSSDQNKLYNNHLYVLGHTNETGLGNNLKMSVRALQETGIEPIILSADDTNFTIDKNEIKVATKFKKPVILFHINADRVPDEISKLPSDFVNRAYKIGFFLWETSIPPKSHLLGLNIVDDIWVPTNYLTKIYGKYTSSRVLNIKKGITPPKDIKKLSRNLFSLSDDDFVFLAMGDFHSSIVRKNPLGVVQAFKHAFPNRDDVKLILKIRNIEYDHWSNRNGHWDNVEEEIIGDPRITVFDKNLSDSEYWGMLRMCDCFVSLHKAEGFGYGLAHSMLMETPVITSDYSGSQDFCTESTAFLVPVKEVIIEKHEMPFTVKGACWAEPNIEIASQLMQGIVEKPTNTAAKVKYAKENILKSYDMKGHSKRYFKLLKDMLAKSNTL
jgi:hypothetical protein